MPLEYPKDSTVLPLIFNCLVEGILLVNSNGEIVRINPSCLEIFGYTEKELIGQKIEVLIPKNFHKTHRKNRSSFIKSPQVRKMASSVDLSGLKKDGSHMPLEISLSYLKHRGNIFVVAFIVDVTDKREFEKAKSQAIVEEAENERRRVANELEHVIDQALSSISLMLKALEPELDSFNQKFLERYTNLKEQLTNTIQEVRNISHNLTPKILEDYGLERALEYLCAMINESTEIEVKLYFYGDFSTLREGVAIGLYRVIQEVVNNALRHGKPTKVEVHLTIGNREIMVLVEDNGEGFNVQNTPRGLGMSNIQSRVNLLKGEVHFDSSEKKGTTVSVNVPI